MALMPAYWRCYLVSPGGRQSCLSLLRYRQQVHILFILPAEFLPPYRAYARRYAAKVPFSGHAWPASHPLAATADD